MSPAGKWRDLRAKHFTPAELKEQDAQIAKELNAMKKNKAAKKAAKTKGLKKAKGTAKKRGK